LGTHFADVYIVLTLGWQGYGCKDFLFFRRTDFGHCGKLFVEWHKLNFIAILQVMMSPDVALSSHKPVLSQW